MPDMDRVCTTTLRATMLRAHSAPMIKLKSCALESDFELINAYFNTFHFCCCCSNGFDTLCLLFFMYISWASAFLRWHTHNAHDYQCIECVWIVWGIIMNSSLKFCVDGSVRSFCRSIRPFAGTCVCGQCQCEANGTSTFRALKETCCMTTSARSNQRKKKKWRRSKNNGKKCIFVRCLENWNRQTDGMAHTTSHEIN